MIRKTLMNKTALDRMLMQTTIRCVYLHIAECTDIWGSAPHEHDYNELCFVLKGKGIYNINDIEYSMDEGDIFLLPKGVRHGEVCNREDPYMLCFLMVEHMGQSAASMDAMFFSKPERLHSNIQSKLFLHKEIEALYEEIIKSDEGYLSVVDGILRQIYVYMYRQLHELETALETKLERGNRYETLLIEMRSFVILERGCRVSVDELAQRFHYHPKYLTQLVKRETGKTLTEFILSIRLESAKELLGKTQHSIDNISDMAGFHNSNYFFRVFKREIGMTPSQYRKLYRNAPQDHVVQL